MSNVSLNTALKTAIVWTIVSDICRRHHGSQTLRIQIMRPASGQYFCVALMRPGVAGAWFNLAGTSLHLTHDANALEKPGWWKDGYLVASVDEPGLPEVVRDIEKLLLLKPSEARLPPTTPPVLGIRCVAALAQKYAFGRGRFHADCGFFDSSGEGCHIQEWVRSASPADFAAAERALETSDVETSVRHASKYWSLGLSSNAAVPQPKVVLNLATGVVVRVARDEPALNLVATYDQAERRLAPVVDRLAMLLEEEP